MYGSEVKIDDKLISSIMLQFGYREAKANTAELVICTKKEIKGAQTFSIHSRISDTYAGNPKRLEKRVSNIKKLLSRLSKKQLIKFMMDLILERKNHTRDEWFLASGDRISPVRVPPPKKPSSPKIACNSDGIPYPLSMDDINDGNI